MQIFLKSEFVKYIFPEKKIMLCVSKILTHLQTVEEGCQTLMFLALSGKAVAGSGNFFVDCKVRSDVRSNTL